MGTVAKTAIPEAERAGSVTHRQFFPALLGLVLSFVLVFATVPVRAAPYAAMVMDARTGEILHSRNAETRLHPASLTKMMTLYIAFEALRLGEITLDTRVQISRNAAAEPPSKLGLQAGSHIRFRYLIRAAAIRSANDAATAIGEVISGSEAEFARRMTLTAQALGMRNTTFRNAHGLTAEGHLSTAHDMTIMGRRLFYDYPQYYNIFSRQTADAGIAQVRNTNRAVLSAYRGADGIKTGYTRAAGFNLVSSAERGQERIIATVFGGRSTAWRNQRIMELLDMGFERAPSTATVRRPALPTYDGIDLPPGPNSRGSGLVARSLRPVVRPGGTPEPALLAAIETAVEDVIGDVVPEAAIESVVADALADAVAAVPEAAEQGIDAGSLDLQAEIARVLEPVLSDGVPPGIIPSPRPRRAQSAPAAQASVDEAGAAPEPTPAPASASTQTAPQPTEVAATDEPEPSNEPLVVTRASSTGSRLYGVTLGSQSSHHAAERLLLRTALSEIGTFDTALRRVEQRNGGYEAVFQGMTEDQARHACARLSARNISCDTVGPG